MLARAKMDGAPAVDVLFKRFDAAVNGSGYLAMGGQIVDATIVAAPKQRNTKDEKQAIKEGRIPEDWKAKPAKLRQKDRDARWTVKFSKAKERADGTKPAVDIAIPKSASSAPHGKAGGIAESGSGPVRRHTLARVRHRRSVPSKLPVPVAGHPETAITRAVTLATMASLPLKARIGSTAWTRGSKARTRYQLVAARTKAGRHNR